MTTINNAFPQQSICILTDEPNSSDITKLATDYAANNYIVHIKNLDSLIQDDEIYNLLIVDLDTLIVKDTEEFCELISEKATRILIICSKSFQRLQYYRAFECYTSYDNLLNREFFAFNEV